MIASSSLEPGNDYSHINKYYSALFWTWFLMKIIIFDFSVLDSALDVYIWFLSAATFMICADWNLKLVFARNNWLQLYDQDKWACIRSNNHRLNFEQQQWLVLIATGNRLQWTSDCKTEWNNCKTDCIILMNVCQRTMFRQTELSS